MPRQRIGKCSKAWSSRSSGLPAVAPMASMVLSHVDLAKMGQQDNLEAFLELYEHSMMAWGWPEGQWAACLLLL